MKSSHFLVAASLFFLTACGSPDDNESVVSNQRAPNLIGKITAADPCKGFLFMEIANIGDADAGAFQVRVDQSNASSTANFVTGGLKKNDKILFQANVVAKNGKVEAKIEVDFGNRILESNEKDNIIKIVCN